MSMIRSFFFKLCFLVGFGTLAYQGALLFGVIKPSNGMDAISKTDSSVFQDKVDLLAKSEDDRVEMIKNHNRNKTRQQQQQQMNKMMDGQLPVAAVAAAPMILGTSPLPEGSPVAAAPCADAEAPKNDEVKLADANSNLNKEGESKVIIQPCSKPGEKVADKPKLNPDGSPVVEATAANASPTPVENLPIAQQLPMLPYYPYGYPPNPNGASPVTSASANAEVNPNVNGLSPNGSSSGLTPIHGETAGVTTTAPGETLAEANAMNGSGNGSPHAGGGAVSTTPGGSSNPAAILSTQDVKNLTQAYKATFAVQASQVTGLLCNQAGAGANVCSRSNNITVDSSRWDISNGLESAATFAVKDASGAMTVQAGITIQDGNLIPQTANLNLSPSTIRVTSSTRGNANYKTYTLTFPDTKAFGSEMLTQMQAVLVFQVTGATGVLSAADSSFTFGRRSVTTVTNNWDPNSPTRAPAQSSTPYVVADDLQFSMSLHN